MVYIQVHTVVFILFYLADVCQCNQIKYSAVIKTPPHTNMLNPAWTDCNQNLNFVKCILSPTTFKPLNGPVSGETFEIITLNIFSFSHPLNGNRWCRSRWRGWVEPERRIRAGRWSSGGRPRSRRSCLWGSGAPDRARGPGQSPLCPRNEWKPSRWRCPGRPACPCGGAPARRNQNPLCVRKIHRCCRSGCSSGGGEDGSDSCFLCFVCGGDEKRKIYEKFYTAGKNT